MISFLKFNFAKKNKILRKPKAAVFVDYEHWYISLEKLYSLKPNIKAFVDELNEKVDISELIFFGDFSGAGMQNEMQKIRAFTNKIVETKNASGYYKKDFTDFIILDHIYQKALSSEKIDSFIIFTGDGHFSSVALFLKNTCKKEVGIYGVKNAFSNQLKQAASWYSELPSDDDRLLPYCQIILSNLFALKKDGRKNSFATFGKTVEAVSAKYNLPAEKVKEALLSLIERKYINVFIKKINFAKSIKAISPDWTKISDDNLWREGMNIRLPVQSPQNQK